ncbi:MAG: presenilin family intramembrane aspartyl protease [Nanoarchaeota archaeon]
MKHTAIVTLFLIAIFFITQIVGLSLISKDISQVSVDENNQVQIQHSEGLQEFRPQTTGASSLIYILISIAIGTIVLLFLVKFRKVNVWKAWFFVAVLISITIAFMVITQNLWASLAIAAVLAVLKIWRQNFIIHNFTEIFMYAGIAVLLVPIFNIIWALVLLGIISVYDVIAVWQSKHMVKMANFQTDSKVFAGLMIPYTRKKAGEDRPVPMEKLAKGKASLKIPLPAKKMKKGKSGFTDQAIEIPDEEHKTAILGGGDVAFPLIFSGVVMENLIEHGLPKSTALLESFIIAGTTTLAIAALFLLAKKDKFYPAMPIVTIGCLVGWGIILLL